MATNGREISDTYSRCTAHKGCRIVRLTDEPEMKSAAAEWFHEKWGIPVSAYLDSMDECLKSSSAVPQWYMALDDGNRLIGGMGVIDNDFHDRKELTPNVCAVYVEEQWRGQRLAGKILDHVYCDMKTNGIDTLYLVTDHVGLYERYGWEFLCMVQGDGEDHKSRMYMKKL